MEIIVLYEIFLNPFAALKQNKLVCSSYFKKLQLIAEQSLITFAAHCVKRFQIRSYFWSVTPHLKTFHAVALFSVSKRFLFFDLL